MGALFIIGPDQPGSPHRMPCPVMSYDCIELGVCCMAFTEARSDFHSTRGRGVGRVLITWWFGVGAEASRVLILDLQVPSPGFILAYVPTLFAPALICPS